ncbi:MAG: entericidin A/B family lipoprotein [Burkholderiaceae bacterium]|nr:entericidin A/B family lipoprotein [Burkholderiaceae bacterium]
MHRLPLLIAALVAALSLSACNTVRGVGQDIKKAGETIEGAAKK